MVIERLTRPRGARHAAALAAALAWALVLCPPAHAQAPAAAPVVTVCVDPDPSRVPPGTNLASMPRGDRSPGFSIELAEAAFALVGRPLRLITEYPWSRCLKLVEDGDIDFALGAYHSSERARRFAYTVRYQRLSPRVFFHKQRPVQVNSTADLRKYRGCGMRGASYEHYGLAAKDLDLGVNEYAKLVDKLMEGRCDYFVEELEVFSGMNLPRLQQLAEAPVPGAVAPTKHLVTRLGGRGEALIPDLNRAIAELIRSGRAARLWEREAGSVPYQP